VQGDSVSYGHAFGIDDNGALLVGFPDGHTEAVNTGEVSIRDMYGYV
jgi:biotin-(acetyl-CoA carboxylase) ligase